MIHSLFQTWQVLDPWFGRPPRPIELDLGCGWGRFALDLAARHPERLVLASDLLLARLRAIQGRVAKRGLANLELLYVNSLQVTGWLLPDGCVTRVHLLCPDPWPKARHRARRIMTADFVSRVARILKPGGVLHLATDHPPYAATLREVVECLPLFTPDPAGIADIADLETGFERLWQGQGKTVPHLAYRKTADG
ncbi:MAG: methyltransferase domain-containing protein [Lentisphaeria bacterium]|jgi:tRNA (guanine-N7-)-methyltransferase